MFGQDKFEDMRGIRSGITAENTTDGIEASAAPWARARFGGGRERHFDNGELRFVILQLIADKPSYGYEIIKAIEERLSGGYAPSPGVVYPTLTMLEEEGYATVSSTESNKKLYAATEVWCGVFGRKQSGRQGYLWTDGAGGQSLWQGEIAADYAGDYEPAVCVEDPDGAWQFVSGADEQNSGGHRCCGPVHRRGLTSRSNRRRRLRMSAGAYTC